MAEIAFGHFQGFLQRRREVLLQRIKSNFKVGKTDAVTLSSGLAALFELDDLEAEIKASITRANKVSKELYEQPGKPSDS